MNCLRTIYEPVDTMSELKKSVKDIKFVDKKSCQSVLTSDKNFVEWRIQSNGKVKNVYSRD